MTTGPGGVNALNGVYGAFVDSIPMVVVSGQVKRETIAGNTGGDGSGLYIVGGAAATLTNTILVSQTVGITVAANSTATLIGTLWGSGAWANGINWGGEGTIVGTVIGALIIGTIQYGLVLLGVSPFWQYVAIGLVVILAVVMDQFGRNLGK